MTANKRLAIAFLLPFITRFVEPCTVSLIGAAGQRGAAADG
jgi:hypothetical protein